MSQHWHRKRVDVNTVFQNYALFPHMTVAGSRWIWTEIKKDTKKQRLKNEYLRCWNWYSFQDTRERKPSRTFRWTETACGNCPFAGQ